MLFTLKKNLLSTHTISRPNAAIFSAQGATQFCSVEYSLVSTLQLIFLVSLFDHPSFFSELLLFGSN